MPSEKRWGPSQERDLAIAIILSQAGDRPKYNWEKITEIMSNWGHAFTRDAVNQHWSKRIMKEFKERHGNAAAKGGLSCAAASDSSKEDSSRVATPASRKRKRTKAMKEVDDIEAEDVKDTPSKNRKVKAEPKKEEKF